MIEGAKWRRWVFFYLPLGAFIFVLLFPFYWMMVTAVRPDSELYRPWMAPNYTPFWTLHPTLDHIKYLLSETLFSTWMLNTLIISIVATTISLICGLFAGYALARLQFPFAGSLGTGIFITYLVPQPDGPTSTKNSLSRISRFTSFTACTSSYILFKFRIRTRAIASSLYGTGEAGNVVLDKERVDQGHRHRAQQCARHQRSPKEHIAADQL